MTQLLERYQKGEKLSNEELLLLQQTLKKAYYETGSPLITDEQYDAMFNLNEESVGYELSEDYWPTIKHTIPMYSLFKIKTFDEATKWIDKINKRFNSNIKYVIEPKLDGLSVELEYKDGNLVHAVTRGDGIEGKDIIQNAVNFAGVPTAINTPHHVFIRGEIVISKSNFEKLEGYKNRRNAVSGISMRHDSEYSSLLSVKVYDVLIEDVPMRTETSKAMILHNLGFDVPFVTTELTEENYLKYASIRTSAEDYQMDGFVIKIDDCETQDILGFKDCRPLGIMALKFPPEGVETIITDYEWNVGSTGILMPKINVQKVDLQGISISNVSAGSYDLIRRENLQIGSRVIVRRMGDVIPKITEVIEASNGGFKVPDVCPSCGNSLMQDGANLKCTNTNCLAITKARLGSVIYSLGLKNIGSKIFLELVDKGFIKSYVDFFKVTADTLSQNSKTSNDRAIAIVSKIQDSLKAITFEQVLGIVNIPKLGGSGIKKLKDASNQGMFPLLLDWSKDTFIELLGNSKGTTTYETIQQDRDNLIELLNLIHNV
jgi:DNA ligase (NAD+)